MGPDRSDDEPGRHRLDALFWPRSVAVVGASTDPSRIRGRLFQALRQGGFRGAIYPVTRSHDVIDGLPCYPAVHALPETPDLAIIAVPAEVVGKVLRECAQRGVRAALIMSSGFREQGDEEGRSREREVAEIGATSGMLVCGPNAEGFYNARLPLTATFSPAVTPAADGAPVAHHGLGVGIVSQSGGVGFAIYSRGEAKRLDVTHVVSMGNEAGLCSLEVVDYLLDDGATGVLALFVEGFRSPRAFPRIATKAARARKPIIAAKMGKSAPAVEAAVSHTATLAGSYRAYEAVFRRHGVTIAADAEQMVDLANAFARCRDRLPAGKRVGILTASGGAGIWLTDTCAEHGLEVTELDRETQARLAELMPAYGNTRNPVDITAQGVYGFGYAKPLALLAASPRIDAIIAVCSMIRPEVIVKDADNLRRLAGSIGKPVLFCSYTPMRPEAVRHLVEAGFPCTDSMPNACRSVAAMAEYARFLERFASRGEDTPRAEVPVFARSIEGSSVLCEYEAKRVLLASGIGSPGEHLVQSADGAVAAFERLRSPVAVKVQSPDIVHKTEAGGVALGLATAPEVREAYGRVMEQARRAKPDARIHGVLVQRMAPAGIEVIIGVERDPDFGPLLMVGLGGVLVEMLDDVVFSPVPLGVEDAHRLLDGLRARRLLDGARGAAAADVEALVEVLMRLSRFAHAHAESVAEIELNPIIVHPRGQGLSIVDALMVKRARLPAGESFRAGDRIEHER